MYVCRLYRQRNACLKAECVGGIKDEKQDRPWLNCVPLSLRPIWARCLYPALFLSIRFSLAGAGLSTGQRFPASGVVTAAAGPVWPRTLTRAWWEQFAWALWGLFSHFSLAGLVRWSWRLESGGGGGAASQSSNMTTVVEIWDVQPLVICTAT